MKLTTVIPFVFFALIPHAWCGDGKVIFTGALASDACIISTNDTNQTVNLGSVPTASFHAAGDKSSPSGFTIGMSNCPESMVSVIAKFDGMPDKDNSDLLALDSDSTAKYIAVGIEETNNTLIPLHTPSQSVAIDKTSHSTEMAFQARYIATSAMVSPGPANAVSQFSINYN